MNDQQRAAFERDLKAVMRKHKVAEILTRVYCRDTVGFDTFGNGLFSFRSLTVAPTTSEMEAYE